MIERFSYILIDILKRNCDYERPILFFLISTLKPTAQIINKNSLTLIKGRSGSGKTTLLNCLCGLLKINSGIIKYDKKNINNINRNSLANNTGYVLQENFFLMDQ